MNSNHTTMATATSNADALPNSRALANPFVFGAPATSFPGFHPTSSLSLLRRADPSPVRRVKPLPRSKRRRTGDDEEGFPDDGDSPPPGGLGAFPMPPYFYPPFNEYPIMTAATASSQDDADSASAAHNESGDGAGADTDRDRDQQGNTKKRKVPAAAHHFRTSSSDNDAAGEGRGESDQAAGGGGHGTAAAVSLASSTKLPKSKPEPKLSPAAASGMRLKEALKARKRLLATMLGSSVADEDTLALDLALSAPLNWHLQGFSKSKKYFSRSSAVKRRKLRSVSGPRYAMPSGEFTFTSPSPSGERLKSVTAEMSLYRAQFNAELALLVTKQAEAAKKAAATASSEGKRSARRTKGTPAGTTPSTPQSSEIAGAKSHADGGTNPDSSKKKKKRSGKAADPHQIKNYIPSRLPSGNGVPQPPTASQAALNMKNFVSPHPVLFLSAEPTQPRRRRNASRDRPVVASSLPPVQPMDEWICTFCEYSLFYGDETACRRAVRSRKKLLNRRRRARERAAAAASGQAKLLPKKTGSGYGSEDDGEEEDVPEEEREARFADPAEVEARVAANVNANAGDQGRAVARDKDKNLATSAGVPPPATRTSVGSSSKT